MVPEAISHLEALRVLDQLPRLVEGFGVGWQGVVSLRRLLRRKTSLARP
jgi:hypothetical protein